MEEILVNESLEELLNKQNYCIVYDTNIFLNFYEYSPEVTDFFIKITESDIKNIVITSTVYREFQRNHITSLNRQRNKFKNMAQRIKTPLDVLKSKFEVQFGILDELRVTDIQELRTSIFSHVEQMEVEIEGYIENHEGLNQLITTYLESDYIYSLINDICRKGNLLEDLSIDEIYEYCKEGEKRYKKQIPPGYKDAKDKNGVEAYGDLFIWKEAIVYCLENKLDLIFVTDDVKEDWYMQGNSSPLQFRLELAEEFHEITQKNMVGVPLREFAVAISKLKNIQVPALTEWIAGNNVDQYISSIEEDDLTSQILEELLYSGTDFVEESTLSGGYDGSFFEFNENSISDFEIEKHSFAGISDGFAKYDLICSFRIEAISQTYYGKDEDTNESQYGNPFFHELSGEVHIKISREIDSFWEDAIDRNNFDELIIVDGQLSEEDGHSFEYCSECERNEAVGSDCYGNPLCDRCLSNSSEGEICPRCGRRIPMEYMAGTGFCLNCENED